MIKTIATEREIFVKEEGSTYKIVMIGNKEIHQFSQAYTTKHAAVEEAKILCDFFSAIFVGE